ncbi:SCP2 sterol-binding domain-containing protein [Pseudoruegeria sp. SHC-113]|uniref:SCP2 sterol-binding domain-containing protein n=1 Tax=Pseudoruegeria sp. SHC-113 TaxID=2855439 RepID=UPI0021BB8262|nr:SCP2 sterol-binding domain-containing protein [Pseudoruegeria sp. SHC-113]MCT8160852.1 SCP2 sterol-binding domain-containing protein [Pseudoruegeria sp. SHC-113]
MSEFIQKVINGFNKNLSGKEIDASFKFVFPEGTVFVDENGAREEDAPADCTLTMKSEVFTGLIKGEVNPAKAFMLGKIKVSGNVMKARKLGELLG